MVGPVVASSWPVPLRKPTLLSGETFKLPARSIPHLEQAPPMQFEPVDVTRIH
jgi:hypothetical protein